jgi:hypothetical protein
MDQFRRVPQAGWQAHQPVMVLLHGEGQDIEALVDAGIAEADGGPLGFAYIGTVPEHGPAKRLLEILDPYVIDEPAHESFREVQQLARARHQRVHLVYAPMQDRAESAANLWTVLDPRELIVLRCDEAALAAIVPGSGRHTETDGVELTIHSAG